MKSTWKPENPFGKLFKSFIIIFLVLFILLASLTLWVNWGLDPVSENKQEKTFVIKKSESSHAFAKRLEDEKLVRSALIFRLYIKLSGVDKKIQAGSFKLSPDNTVQEIAETLTKGRIDKWVTIVEGLRKEQIAETLSKEFDIDKKAFLTKAEEGKLFPDTYLLPLNSDYQQILKIFTTNFEKKFDDSLKEKIKKTGLTEKEALTLASIVERESRNADERPVIAGILIKRLKEGITLGADATVQYALGYSKSENSWWRKVLTEEDLQIVSPYNTRKKIGLPPGPISNPGLSSLKAIATPKETPYYYYLHDGDGRVHYGETFEQHQENIAKYLN